jgi:hypothetical protein
MKEVTKFNDLMVPDMHGIMVSLHGGSWADAVWKWSKCTTALRGVPLENEYDVDQIADMVQLIYTWMRTQKVRTWLTPCASRQRHFSVCSWSQGTKENPHGQKPHMKETQVLLNMSVVALEQPWFRKLPRRPPSQRYRVTFADLWQKVGVYGQRPRKHHASSDCREKIQILDAVVVPRYYKTAYGAFSSDQCKH